jgi:hypothetical protein
MKYLQKFKIFESVEIKTGSKIEVIDSPDPNIRIEGDKQVCGNVFYHGAMLDDVNKSELSQYFSKEGRFQFKQTRLTTKKHKALFITPSFREALQWAQGNIFLEFDKHKKEKTSNISPSVYKVTLKPGILLERNVITNFEYGERERIESKGFSGSYGGVNPNPSSVIMSECGILNPNSVIDWELIQGNEILKYIKSDKYNPKLYNKNLNRESFDSLMKSIGINVPGIVGNKFIKNPIWDECEELFLDPFYKYS